MTIQIISIVVVLVIVVFYLARQNKKDKKYFGEQATFNHQQKKIMERYKKEYQPIKHDDRLATLDKDKWELEDVAKSATELIYDFPIPTKTQRQSLEAGSLVKLKFMTDEDGETEVERMWVKVIE